VVTPAEAPELHAVIDRLCALADMPKPVVAVSDADLPNAFATGRSAKRAVVCVTTGLLRRLEPAELEGVLAHELSHVAHRDVAVMTIASFVSVVAGTLVRFGGHAPRGRRNSHGGSAVLLVIAASVAVYAVSFLLIRVLSRYRELSADRSAALLTGRPSALASALVKISGEMGRIPTTDLRGAEPYNAFFLVPALSPGFSISTLFSTHPSLEQRLERLGRLSGDLGRRG
jgi:heat shock protein HtpX